MKGKKDIKMRPIDEQNMIMSLKDEARSLEEAYDVSDMDE